jgi:hypothetical protein
MSDLFCTLFLFPYLLFLALLYDPNVILVGFYEFQLDNFFYPATFLPYNDPSLGQGYLQYLS